MITRLARRALEGTVLVFATLGFIYVPLGQHTGYQHLRRVLATEEAKEAAGELGGKMQDVVREVTSARLPLAAPPNAPIPTPTGSVRPVPALPNEVLAHPAPLSEGPPLPPRP